MAKDQVGPGPIAVCLARLDKIDEFKKGPRGWAPPPEVGARMLELFAQGATGAALCRALEGTPFAAEESTVRRWLTKQTRSNV